MFFIRLVVFEFIYLFSDPFSSTKKTFMKQLFQQKENICRFENMKKRGKPRQDYLRLEQS